MLPRSRLLSSVPSFLSLLSSSDISSDYLLPLQFGQLPIMYIQNAVYESGPYLLLAYGRCRAEAESLKNPTDEFLLNNMRFVYPQEVEEDKDYADFAPLEYAVIHRHMGMIVSLLRAGANPNGSRWREVTPLHWAVKAGDLELISLLRAHPHLNINKGLVSDPSPLHCSSPP